MTGPHEGMYLINPKHLRLNPPQNCLDEEIALHPNARPERGLRPTPMTYFMQRLRLGELSRELVDTLPMKITGASHDQVMALDAKIQDFISSLPYFFRVDPESLNEAKDLETIYPAITIQRFTLMSNTLSKRCKIHQPFMIRQSLDRRFAFSRSACLDSARTIMKLQREMPCSDLYLPYTATRNVSAGIASQLMHLAIIILAMDFYFNPGEVDESERKAEVRAGLKTFEQAQASSPFSGRLMESLINILQKHKIQLPERPPAIGNMTNSYTPPATATDNFSHGPSVEAVPSIPITSNGADVNIQAATRFDEFWNTFVNGEPTLDSSDNLFSDLASNIL